jgi:hypothetical protein
MDNVDKEYRKYLQTAYQKAQENYDTNVLKLSGGALGVTFAFLKDVIRSNPVIFKRYLFGSWVCWGFSVSIALLSYWSSSKAFRRAAEKYANGQEDNLGGKYNRVTEFLNFIAGFLFLVGVILMAVFVGYNVGGINVQQK